MNVHADGYKYWETRLRTRLFLPARDSRLPSAVRPRLLSTPGLQQAGRHPPVNRQKACRGEGEARRGAGHGTGPPAHPPAASLVSLAMMADLFASDI